MNPLIKIFFACYCMCLATTLPAQDTKIVWGKVPDEDLKMTVYDKDTAAAAVVLFDVGNLKFDFGKSGIKYIFERHKRIKILKRSGFDYADISIPFFNRESVKGLRAQIYLPNGEKSTVEKGGFFDETVSKGGWVLKKFAFPNVQEGAVIEYKFSLESEYFIQLQDWFFQQDIPVRWSEYNLAIPEWFDYVVIRQGRQPDIIDKKMENEKLTISSGSYGTSRTEYYDVPAKVHYYRMAMRDVPAMKMEAFVTTGKDYLARTRFQLKSVQWPQSPLEPYMTTWPDVAKKLLEHESFGQQFLKKNNYNKVWEQASFLLKETTTEKEKAERLYQFVARTITWDEDFGVYTRNSLNKCFEQKKGSAAEMNLMLLALFKEAGIEASPALASTRDHGKPIQIYPILAQFNHVMVLAKIEGKSMLFDAGSPFRPANYPRISALNGSIWAVNMELPQWLDISSTGGSTVISYKCTLAESGNLSGRLRGKYDGYDAVLHREKLHAKKEEEHWKTYLADESGVEVTIESVKTDNLDSISLSLSMDMQCALQGVAQVADDFIYLSPVLLSPFDENPFKLAERNYPVEIPYPINYQFVLQLEIPEGYAIEELPETLNMSLPDKGGLFQYSINSGPNTVNVSYKLRIDQLVFEPDEYAGLKEFFDRIMSKHAEQVVLKKQ